MLEKKMHECETMYQQECNKLHEQICVNHETVASLVMKMNEQETELDEKVCKKKESMEAAKESKLANLEQRYTCCKHQVTPCWHEDEDIPHASTTDQEPPVPPSYDNGQLPSSQASTVIDAVTKGMEATLKNILANGQALSNLKYTP
ncbi:hypothetical protein EDD17DRAFT_1514515 [Pisolithus thermaeus]|nr:hypothetical protein EDD17DRAFT_1514515 [Pisolithus thermaeus]